MPNPFAEPKLWIHEFRPNRNLQWLRASCHIPIARRILAAPLSRPRAQCPAHPQRPTREHTLLIPRATTHPELSSTAEPVRRTTWLPGPAAATHAVWPARPNTRPARRRTACAIRPVPVRAGLWPPAGAVGIRWPPARRVQWGDAVIPSAPESVPVPGRVWRPGPRLATWGTPLRQQSRVLGEWGPLSSRRKQMVCWMTRPREFLDRPSDRSKRV